MNKHTPGPWVQWADTNIVIRLHTGRPHAEDLRICEVATNTWKDEGRHNASLIAAAPELLEALQMIFRSEALPLFHWQRAKAAIEKATGVEV